MYNVALIEILNSLVHGVSQDKVDCIIMSDIINFTIDKYVYFLSNFFFPFFFKFIWQMT